MELGKVDIYEVCTEGVQPCNIKNRDIYWRHKIQETLHTGQWHFSPLQSRHHGTSHSSPKHHHLPHHIFLNLIDGLKSLPLSKVILVLGKTRSCRVLNMGYSRAESHRWFDVLPKTCARDVMHKQAHCHDEAANHQLPIAVAFWIIYKECSSLTQNLMQIRHSARSVILNVMATQCTCSLDGVDSPHWLVQWSRHCSRMCIPVHSPWLPGDIEVTQTVLIWLTWLDFFQTDLIYFVYNTRIEF